MELMGSTNISKIPSIKKKKNVKPIDYKAKILKGVLGIGYPSTLR